MDNAKPSQPPWNLEFRSSKKFVITVVSIAVFTVCLYCVSYGSREKLILAQDFFIYGMVGAVRKRRRHTRQADGLDRPYSTGRVEASSWYTR